MTQAGPLTLPPGAQEVRRLWNEADLRARLGDLADEADSATLWIRALAHHNLAALGVRGEAAQAETALKRLLAAEPDHALALAYLGNATIMIARDSRNFVTKPATVRNGLVHLDRAVELAPDHVAIRLLRAGSGKRLPKLFNRRGQVIADLRRAAELLEASGEDPLALAEVFHDLADLSGEDAAMRRRYLLSARDAAPRSTWGAASREIFEREFGSDSAS
ncbi:hypothetical protein ASD38_20790 [Caulobacter sp. Root487D2Y]|uniref:hypothetical protein n=1 Tax=Caulobacter sp. Root487D2Y TaxID=1736547 RepID=UPI0006FCA2CF|nr:hypothetical protein [Caulobacter sp. Root487D2Y]KQY26181.1 hypothetical protein ASD38_20790 [Caulobacter sp. Root487D2Y]